MAWLYSAPHASIQLPPTVVHIDQALWGNRTACADCLCLEAWVPDTCSHQVLWMRVLFAQDAQCCLVLTHLPAQLADGASATAPYAWHTQNTVSHTQTASPPVLSDGGWATTPPEAPLCFMRTHVHTHHRA